MNCFTIAIAAQTAFVIWFSISHFISLPPLNDLSKEAFPGEHKVNLFLLGLWILGIVGFYTEFLGTCGLPQFSAGPLP